MSVGIIPFYIFLLPILFFSNVGGFNANRPDASDEAANLESMNTDEGGIAASANLTPLNYGSGLEPDHSTSTTNLTSEDLKERKNYFINNIFEINFYINGKSF